METKCYRNMFTRLKLLIVCGGRSEFGQRGTDTDTALPFPSMCSGPIKQRAERSYCRFSHLCRHLQRWRSHSTPAGLRRTRQDPQDSYLPTVALRYSALPAASNVPRRVPGGRLRLHKRSSDADRRGITMFASYSMYLGNTQGSRMW